MASYLTAMMIALISVVGLHVTLERNSNGLLFYQDRLGEHTTTELLEIAFDPKSPDQIEAILQLGFRPGDLSKTVPALAKISARSQFDLPRLAADMALAEIGEAATEQIQILFDSKDRRKVILACAAVHSIGASGKTFLPEIKQCMASSDVGLRRGGLFALQGFGDSAVDVIDELVACIENEPNFNNKCSACRIIEKIGPDAFKAQNALVVLLDEGNPSTRGWAAICLGAIGQTSSDVDIALLLSESLKKRTLSPEIRRIILGLAKLGPNAAVATDDIRQRSKSKDYYVKIPSAYALWRITGESEESLEILESVLNVAGQEDDALEILAKMGEISYPLLGNVEKFLKSPNAGTRELALVALSNMGSKAKGAAPGVKRLLNDADPMVRVAARQTLLDIK